MSIINDPLHDAPPCVTTIGRLWRRLCYGWAFLRLPMRHEGSSVCAKARSNIRIMNVIGVLRSALFILPVIMPFALLKAGVTPGQFMMAEAVFALTVVVMEVPTGWISDIWTRRKAMFAGLFLETIGFIILWVMENIWHLLIGQVVIGVGLSLISGTPSALLYDSLIEARMTRMYRKLEGLRHGIGLYSVGIGSIVGAALYSISPDLVIGMTVAALALSTLCCLLLYEPQRVKEAVHGNPIRDIAITMNQSIRKDPYLGRLLLMIAVVFGVTNTAFWTQQPYYMALGLPISLFGAFSAGGHLCGGLGAQLAHLLERHMRFSSVMLAILCWLAVAYLICGAYPGIWGAFLLMSGGTAYGIGFPIIQDEINKRVSSARRATILSCASLSMRLVFVILAMSLGGFMDRYGVELVLLVLAAILSGCGTMAWFALRGLSAK